MHMFGHYMPIYMSNVFYLIKFLQGPLEFFSIQTLLKRYHQTPIYTRFLHPGSTTLLSFLMFFYLPWIPLMGILGI